MAESEHAAAMKTTVQQTDAVLNTMNAAGSVDMPASESHTERHQVPGAQKNEELQETDEDSDFDDLDEVLDDFSRPTPGPSSRRDTKSGSAETTATTTTEWTTSRTATTRTTTTTSTEFDEDAFMKQLEQDMAKMMDQAAQEAGVSADDAEGFEAAIDKGAEAFAKRLEERGVSPEMFLKQLLSDAILEGGREPPPAASTAAARSASDIGADGFGAAAATVRDTGTGTRGADDASDSFTDAIQRTMDRMKESGDRATAAAAEEDEDFASNDLVAQLLKAVEAGAAAGGEEGDLTKMVMGMMEQLSNKEMLYEPMKELDAKFGPWIAEHKGKETVSEEDMTRYETQARVVSEIVAKFEESGYTDDDENCREYIWEKMQEMQAAGNPPDELIANPLLEGAKDPAGAEAPPDCAQQ